MSEENYTFILRRVGTVLIVFGLLDIGVMVYCLAKGMSYSSSFNVFAVIAGIFLLRGSLRAALIIRWLAIFLVTSFICSVLALPFLQPLDLTLTESRLHIYSFFVSAALFVIVVTFLGWVIHELGQETIMSAYKSKGIKGGSSRTAVLLIVLLIAAIFVSVMVARINMPNSEISNSAKEMASAQLGKNYNYHVTSYKIIHDSRGTSVSVVVTAWNHDDIRQIPLHWQENK